MIQVPNTLTSQDVRIILTDRIEISCVVTYERDRDRCVLSLSTYKYFFGYGRNPVVQVSLTEKGVCFLTAIGSVSVVMGRITGKMSQEYSEDLAVVTKKSRGNHKMLLKAIWKYATANNLKGEGGTINADKVLKKLFGKDEIRPMQDMKILRKAGHVKTEEAAA